MAKTSCGMQKKNNTADNYTRLEIETLSERHSRKEITILELIYGLSNLIAKNSANTL